MDILKRLGFAILIPLWLIFGILSILFVFLALIPATIWWIITGKFLDVTLPLSIYLAGPGELIK